MLDFFWPLTAKHEAKVDDRPAHSLPQHSVTSPVLKQLKRKRSDTASYSPPSGQRAAKSATETLTRVEISSPKHYHPVPPRRAEPPADTPQAQRPYFQNGEGAIGQHPLGKHDSGLRGNNAEDEHLPQLQTSTQATTDAMVTPAVSSRPMMTSAALRDTVESQFSLEILLKHRELRLIDQELAKCQVAYEQLRRCSVIPYPSQALASGDMFAATQGRGQTYNNSAPEASTWGIAEGPYSRHYTHWLLSSSLFDEHTLHETPSATSAGKRLPDRMTRGVHADKGITGPQSRSQRGSVMSRLQSISNGHSEAKEEKGPVLVPRKSDGALLKLVCLDCRRSDFNSVQGFINHCRIAHARQFVSHDEAIEASGEVMDHKTEASLTADSNPSRVPAAAGLVHPMIRAARPPSPQLETPDVQIQQEALPLQTPSTSLKTKGVKKALQPAADAVTPSTFHPSPQTPHLSQFLSRLGRDDDLEEMVKDAQNKDEIRQIEAVDSDESEDDEDEMVGPQSRSTRGIVQSSVRPASSNGSRPSNPPLSFAGRHSPSGPPRRDNQHVPKPLSEPVYHSSTHFSGDHDGYMMDLASPTHLSPNTSDVHPAPSLVSDDGDIDNTHSESEASSHHGMDFEDDQYLQPRFVNQEDMDLGEGSAYSFSQPSKAHSPNIARRPRPATARHGQGQRHVSFAQTVRNGMEFSKTIGD